MLHFPLGRDWPRCVRRHPDDGSRECPGRLIPGHSVCLAHLSLAERSDYLSTLTPGADLDFRGTYFSPKTLTELKDALRTQDGAVEVGHAYFQQAVFVDDANFIGVRFNERAFFFETEFRGPTRFDMAHFDSQVEFAKTRFEERAMFRTATFAGDVVFFRAHFGGAASFTAAKFLSRVGFVSTEFDGVADFTEIDFGALELTEVRFHQSAYFNSSRISGRAHMGAVLCAHEIGFDSARFEGPATFQVAAAKVTCRQTQFDSTATLRLRYAEVDLRDALLTAPTAVTGNAAPFQRRNITMSEDLLSARSPSVKVTSMQGVDAAHLVLTDTDLTDCRFIGAFHLDQIRFEGRTVLPSVPQGLNMGSWPMRWSPRRTVAEEHHWRAQQVEQSRPAGEVRPLLRWRPGPYHADPARTPDPEDVVAVYRQLRKAFEDGKNEPGAADFYYGEMEMRRHDRADTPRGERALLHAYWLLSGYGLRASRAFTWLLLAMLTTILLLMGFGLPQHSPAQEATGIVSAGGGRTTFTIDKDDPQNPTGNRFTGERFDKAFTATLNSVIFRSSGQDLTTAGTYIEMTSRLLEPALLALAVLAIRGRIKR